MTSMFLAGFSGALIAAFTASAADAASFVYTGSVQSFVVTQNGLYDLVAAGAQGGGINAGLGARVSGRLALTSGTTLYVVVGGQGTDIGGPVVKAGGGGGGTFIYKNLSTPLVVAGGGSGHAFTVAGNNGVVGTRGGDATCISGGVSFGGTGGSDGNGGGGCALGAGGGGGFLSNGGAGNDSGTGGAGGPGGFVGGANGGGFGGGGGARISSISGGGGGGYSGGGGGGGLQSGGGGGSFLAASATNRFLESPRNLFNGSATIDLFSVTGGVPEPSSWAMLITGFGGIGTMLRRRRRSATGAA